ncbi:substrate-binding domain-containing protein [Nostoc sp. FACHB-152]|uniref:substrate-binding domain-containing protein n=1 Tax=unclassified Nostoc TaxID=2593658 RepID=UPI001687A8DF|nr:MULTISPECIES: substrate-binding domain-containing protein [unclassified Nostoc]MBD2449092.1 substrate-binding domain-containing protein [Nostoc sp. FACHB-152]MBD2471003.1 substrate-binding domain-containing protein [Nostoc sp. FACHB-145]
MPPRLQTTPKAKLQSKSSKVINSVAIIIATLGLTYIPIPGLQKTVIIVSGTELQEPLQELEKRFEQANPDIKLELKFQGSQEIVNNYIDQKNTFSPTILIPANGEILTELSDRLHTTNQTEPFYDSPQPLAKTLLVGIAWPERGKALFPNGRFQWSKLEQAMQAGNWGKVGGSSNWGSFDFVTTDPTRSNSGQLTLHLWTQSKLGGTINADSFNNSSIQTLFSLIKKSVYQPPRSTDILLQEFIVRGPNDADVATVYESIALYRWQQSAASKGKPYHIYYLDPSIETTATAAIVRRDVDEGTAKAAKQFLDFITQPEQQAIFVQYGFRPVNNNVDLKTVPNSPWSQNIPGAEIQPSVKILPPPDDIKTITEIQRQWERAN